MNIATGSRLQRDANDGSDGEHGKNNVTAIEKTETAPTMICNCNSTIVPSNSRKGQYGKKEEKTRWKKHNPKQDRRRKNERRNGRSSQTDLEVRVDTLVLPGAVAILSGTLTNGNSNTDSFRGHQPSDMDDSILGVEGESNKEDTTNMLVEAKLVSDELELMEAEVRDRIKKEQRELVIQAEVIDGSRSNNNSKTNNHHDEQSRCISHKQLGKGSVLSLAVLCIVIVAAIVRTRLIPVDSDPVEQLRLYNSSQSESSNPGGMWSSKGQPGLKLEIINVLDEKWQGAFVTAIQNWDEGYPIDPLTLSITRVDHDFNCSYVEGKVLVCNGDYGSTDWRSITLLYISTATNQIIAATVKMNDYYTEYAGESFKLYSMCHELGQAFGLAHADDVELNRDLGNCMDVTQNESENARPDDSNFLALGRLYGGIDVETGEPVTARAVQDASS